jgi:hypothetical protein
MGTGFIPRIYARVKTEGSLYYLGPDGIGKGTVLDVSRTGWRVEGEHAVSPGMLLALSVQLPTGSAPIQVEKAMVRWVKGREVGLRMVTMQPAEWTRLARFISATLTRGKSLPPSV